MWKTVALCASLFGSAALGLAALARWIEPGALPGMAAIGLCLVGVVLILAAPGGETVEVEEEEPLRPVLARSPSSERLKRIDTVDATRATDKLQTI